SGSLGGAGGGPSRTGLVVPDGSELHVVAVLANAQLALGAGAHRNTPFRRGGFWERRSIAGDFRRPPVNDCLFCRIVARQSPADIVYEDDAVVAFKDLYPKAPVHLLIVPRRHIASLAEATDDDADVLGRCVVAA